MKIAAWNIRGMNQPLKQNGVRHFTKHYNIDVMGILETKLDQPKLLRVMRNKFTISQVNKFSTHQAGRILILWDSSKVIHWLATCNVTSYTFHVSFVYAFRTIVSRRPF